MAKGSDVFRGVLEAARDQLWLDFKLSKTFDHRGIRGTERERALRRFFETRLPPRFGVTTGELIDSGDRRSKQLDLIIYDKSIAQPVLGGDSADLLPCEAVYAVVEVKSVLTAAEAKGCVEAAARIHKLRPGGMRFIGAREDGAAAQPGEYRCMYMVFAYGSNLGEVNWLQNEYSRFEEECISAKVSVSSIDRVVVLDRGLVNPGRGSGVTAPDDPVALFGESYTHLVNFLEREVRNRPEFSWDRYRAAKPDLHWTRLETDPRASALKPPRPEVQPEPQKVVPKAARPRAEVVKAALPKRTSRGRREKYQPGRFKKPD